MAHDWIRLRGRIGRRAYAIIGVVLFALKHNIDRFVASFWFGKPWSIFNYWFFDSLSITEADSNQLRFYATMAAIALPFVAVGVLLTLNRLRDAGLPPGLVLLFFFPFLNLLFFVLLSLQPTQQEKASENEIEKPITASLGRFLPSNTLGSAAAGVLIIGIFGILITVLSVEGLGQYGWGLFIGLPFTSGLMSVLVYGFHQPRSFGSCVSVALLSIVFAAACLFALAIEGLVCLVMALPLGLVLGFLGGVVGYFFQRGTRETLMTSRTYGSIILFLPLLIGLEHYFRAEPPAFEVRTVITIQAPPEKVWQEVIAFTEIPEPYETLFRLGIAYPMRAELQGQGVGATRRCIFSTGAFVEPIEIWEPPRLLRFGVTEQPPVLQETSWSRQLKPPHLNGYLNSKRGEFLLLRLPDGTTRLEGTTWYQNRFWPNRYWQIWSDYIIHRIHWRVLAHIKSRSEMSGNN